MDEEFSIGYWIKRRRKALDMTQKDLANGVGCALITIAKIEADQRRPSREIAGLLAENLKIPEEQRADFIRIMRGQKSAIHLRKIAVTGFQTPEEPIPYQDAPSRILSSEMDKFRGLELIGKISHSRLVRRNAEVIRARNLWGQVKSGESQVLIIQGEPGIGKTRLARELVSEIKTMGGLVLVGECFAEGGMPYAPFVNILQSEVNFPLGLPNPVLADLRTIAPQLAAAAPGGPYQPTP